MSWWQVTARRYGLECRVACLVRLPAASTCSSPWFLGVDLVKVDGSGGATTPRESVGEGKPSLRVDPRDGGSPAPLSERATLRLPTAPSRYSMTVSGNAGR